MGKRGQLSLLLIVGIVVVIIFVMMIGLAATFQETKLQAQAEALISDYVQQGAIQRYVESCIDRITYDALERIGNNGGVIYDHEACTTNTCSAEEILQGNDCGEEYVAICKLHFQHLNTEEPNFLPLKENNITYNISYGIEQQQNQHTLEDGNRVHCVDFPIPAYPYEAISLANLRMQYVFENYGNCRDPVSGPVGYYNLTKLCDKEGVNRQGEVDQQYQSPCGPRSYSTVDGEKTIESMMNEYIRLKMIQCTRGGFQAFRDNQGNLIETSEESVSANVIMSDGGFSVNITYPFNVTISERTPMLLFHTFTKEFSTRLKEVYRLAQDMITEESRDINKDFIEAGLESLRFQEGFSIERIPNACISCEDDDICPCIPSRNRADDIIKIKDNRSLIDGRPFTFFFAMRNRIPVLDYINEQGGAKYDIVRVAGEPIIITPLGVDPDELITEYEYQGWHQDYLEKICLDNNCVDQIEADVSCLDGGATATPDCRSNPEKYMYRYVTVPPFNPSLITYDPDMPADEDVPQPDYKAWMEDENENPLNWDRHDGASTIYTTNFDMGYHEIRVITSDPEGLYDYQDVKVFISDVCEVIAVGYNNYEDIDNLYASIEDLYYVDPSSTICIFPNIEKYRYIDLLEEGIFSSPGFERPPADPTLQLPPSEIDITTIPDDHFKVYNDNDPTHTVQVSARVEGTWGPPFLLGVEVYQCLPHRNEDTFPYPYHELNSNDYHGLDENYVVVVDPFDANHLCCIGDSPEPIGLDWGTPYGQAERCFLYEEYGGWIAFREEAELNKFRTNFNFLNIGIIFEDNDNIITTPGDNEWDSLNDIFKRTFERYCDGDRGNVCGGDAEQLWMVEAACSDDDYDDGQIAGCQGPNDNAIRGTAGACIAYGQGVTFEEQFSLRALRDTGEDPDENDLVANGYCGLERQSSIDNTGWNDGSGVYDCFGKCYSGSCQFADRDDCVCAYATGNNAVCNNVPADALTGEGYRLGTCNIFGEDWFEDRCVDDCVVEDRGPRYFYDGNTCSTIPQCHDKQRNELTFPIVCSDGQDYFADECIDGQAVDRAYYCKWSADGSCSADIECDQKELVDYGVTYGFLFDGGYCTDLCSYIDCNGYAAYDNAGQLDCYESCINNDQCAEGYNCQAGVCIN